MTASTTTTTAKKPCGCGGSASHSASHAGCGRGCGGKGACGCETCQTQSYARPQFFAGQLLTEDDLQSLGDYVVSKNRLHNRYLFGDGVVCGLTVTCPPCESGHVTVNPGYALDCCGNDIVVTCPKDLDVNQMVASLKTSCEDPCAKSNNGTAKPSVSARRYCLYVDYCEQSTDPVAPYASGSACGQAVCEPTRVRESYKFELRCAPEKETASDIGTRFWHCVGDRKAAERTVADAEFLRKYLLRLKEGMASVQERPAPALDEPFWSQMTAHTQTLKTSLGRFAKFRVKDVDDSKLRPVVEEVLAVAGDLARISLHPDPRLSEDQRAQMTEAEDQLTKACESVGAELIELALPRTVARLRSIALLDLSRDLLNERTKLRGQTDEAGAPQMLEFQLLAAGVVFNRYLLGGVAEALVSMRDWLADRMEQQGGTHCTLLCTVNSVAMLPSRSAADTSTAKIAVIAGEVLVPAVQEVLRSCFCNALIPPCAPCDDTGVLLACLTVKDCKVTDICNLDRKFVITAPNLRYWFPEIGRMGEALEAWCCPTCHKEDDRQTEERVEPRTFEESIRAALGHAPSYTKLAVSAILREPSEPLEFLGHADGAPAELQKQMESALAEIKTLKREQTRLRDRIALIEKKKPAEKQPAEKQT
jgi:hypothetical protein